MKKLTILTTLIVLSIGGWLNQAVFVSQAESDTAVYRVTFTSIWSQATHPSDSFPSNAHFSPLTGAIHNDQVTFWQSGQISSAGIELMAETGAIGTLRTEINEAIANQTTQEILTGSGLGSDIGEITISPFTMTKTFPLVTLVSMIAPSPDWFIGVSGESLLDDDGAWVVTKTITLYPYDAGTEDGDSYTLSNPATNPLQPIASIRNIPPFSDQPIGTLTFTRLDVPSYQVYLPYINK